MTSYDYDDALNKAAPKKRRPTLPTFYDVRELARTLMFLAGLAGIVLGDIWLGQHI